MREEPLGPAFGHRNFSNKMKTMELRFGFMCVPLAFVINNDNAWKHVTAQSKPIHMHK